MHTDIAPALIARADRFVTVLREHGLILTGGDVAALALSRVDMFDRIGATEPGTIRHYRCRTAAAARTLFADFDELAEADPYSPVVAEIRRMVAAALVAAG